MTREEYIESVREKLNECEPMEGELYNDEEVIVSAFNDAYQKSMMALVDTTGAFLKTLSTIATVDNCFKEDSKKPVLSFPVPMDFLRMEKIEATGYSRPITSFKDKVYLPEESDAYCRSGEDSPTAFNLSNRIVLMAGNHTNITMTYIPSVEIDQIDEATKNPRIQYIVCYFAASLVRTRQGGKGDFWLQQANELL